MKTAFKTLILAAITMSSLSSFAMTEDEALAINTEGKIQAAMANQACEDCGENDLMNGKIEAAAINNMQVMVKDAETQLKQIQQIGDIVGHSVEDSQGLLKFIGEKETFADRALTELKVLAKNADSLQGDSLFRAYDRATRLAVEIRQLNEETQQTFDKANRN